MDKLERFEKILNLVEKARRLDFLAVEVMERMNKQNVDFYNFYSKISSDSSNNYKTNSPQKEYIVSSVDLEARKKNIDVEIKEKQMETKPEYSEEAIRAFFNAFQAQQQPKAHTHTQPQQPYAPQQPYVQPHSQQQSYAPPYGQYPQQPYGQPQPQYAPQQPQQPQYAQQQPYFSAPSSTEPQLPDETKNEEPAAPTPTQPSPVGGKDSQFIEKMKALSCTIADRIKAQTDLLKQTHTAFTETHRMSFLLWKDIDDYLSNKTNEK